MALDARDFDTIVVGSGFGGVMAAYPLVMAGERVLMIERGDWVARGAHNAKPEHAYQLSAHYCPDTPYRVDDARVPRHDGSFHCVGGPSVFYGAVALRLREKDFAPGPAIIGDSGATWPFGYAELAPYYDWAEDLLGVAGDDRDDPTAPTRHTAYPNAPAEYSRPAQRIADAARRLGLRPFPLPLAINFAQSRERASCVRCGSCDGFACAIGAKNDLASTLIPLLQLSGMELRANAVVVRLAMHGRHVRGATCVDRRTGHTTSFRAGRVILAAGALATPHLILATELERYSPAAHAIGRYLTRHLNQLTLGVFARPTNPDGEFHKQVAIHDFYHGAPGVDEAVGKLGCIQQVTAPGPGYVRRYLPAPVGHLAALGVPHVLGLMSIAEDQPADTNYLSVDPRRRDRVGLPILNIRYRPSARDLAAGRALVWQSRRILREAGALFSVVHELRSFSHALGTVRMGDDEKTAPLDEEGRFRGIDNLYVADGSALPTGGAVNPSLTIAANALRIGSLIAKRPLHPATTRVRLPVVARAIDVR